MFPAKPAILILATLPWLLVAVRSADPGSEAREARYYMVIYGAQEDGYHPLTSHCFATFARVEARAGAAPTVDLVHINWFSRRGHRSGMTFGLMEPDGRFTAPEPGENRTTREALALATRCGLRVYKFGPFEIDPGLYERAARQARLLEGRSPGHRVLYKSCDIGLREEPEVIALNCIHAISDIDRERGPLRTGTVFGEEAARRLVAHFERWIRRPGGDLREAWARVWQATAGDEAGSFVVIDATPPRRPDLGHAVAARSEDPGEIGNGTMADGR